MLAAPDRIYYAHRDDNRDPNEESKDEEK